MGYPLGYAVPGGMALWPSWEASLRLVAPPGEGKTFRALVPILRQHPGPALATSTKADLYELSAVARVRLGPVLRPRPRLARARRPKEPAGPRWRAASAARRPSGASAALLAATGDDADVQNGAFFRDSARDLLKAYLHAAAIAGLDIRAVLDWSRRPEDTTPTDILLSSPGGGAGLGRPRRVAHHGGGGDDVRASCVTWPGRWPASATTPWWPTAAPARARSSTSKSCWGPTGPCT